MLGLDMKTCSGCKESKPVAEFYRGVRYRDGLASRCKKCKRAEKIRRYGIEPSFYDWLMEDQEGKCAICNKPESIEGRALSIDHDHTSGLHRGLLCSRCNRMIGLAHDDIGRLLSAAKYLRFWTFESEEIARSFG